MLLCEILRLILMKDNDVAGALCAQGLKALHQCLLDGGLWQNAWLLTTLPDPCQRPRHAGNEHEMEVISSYAVMGDRLTQRLQQQRQPNNAPATLDETEETLEEQEEGDGGANPGKGRGKRGRGRGR